MKTWIGGALLTALVAVGGTDLGAQRAAPPRGMGRTGPTAGVERILRLEEELELSAAQIEELEAVRSERVQRRASQRARVAELESQLRAGRIDRPAFREQVSALREGSAAEQDAVRARVEAVLTDAQRGRLEQMNAQRRAFAAGRASAMRGRFGVRGGRPGAGLGRPGMRGGRGFAPGMRRGDGFGPGERPRMAPGRRAPIGRGWRSLPGRELPSRGG